MLEEKCPIRERKVAGSGSRPGRLLKHQREKLLFDLFDEPTHLGVAGLKVPATGWFSTAR
jgi:hypothetical protein